MAKKPPERHTRLAARHHKAAKALGQGATLRDAAAKAGLKGNRARKGVTIAEWLRRQDFRELVQKYATEAMSGDEWEAINAQVARFARPERVIADGDGNVVQVVYANERALDRQGRALGKFKDFVGSGPDGAILHDHRFAELTDEQLEARLAEKLAGLQVRNG